MIGPDIGFWRGSEERQCDQCPETFFPKTPKQLRCSKACSAKANRAARKRHHANRVQGGIRL